MLCLFVADWLNVSITFSGGITALGGGVFVALNLRQGIAVVRATPDSLPTYTPSANIGIGVRIT